LPEVGQTLVPMMSGDSEFLAGPEETIFCLIMTKSAGGDRKRSEAPGIIGDPGQGGDRQPPVVAKLPSWRP
jgi:hypothetical protein